MLRIGRTVINPAEIVKVVNDSKRKTTTVHFKNGSAASYKKHADSVWNYFKGSSVSKQVAGPSSAATRPRW